MTRLIDDVNPLRSLLCEARITVRAARRSPPNDTIWKFDLCQRLIHDVDLSQLGEAQWCISPISTSSEALLDARRGAATQ